MKYVSSYINFLHLQHAVRASLGFGLVGGVIMVDIWVVTKVESIPKSYPVLAFGCRYWRADGYSSSKKQGQWTLICGGDRSMSMNHFHTSIHRRTQDKSGRRTSWTASVNKVLCTWITHFSWIFKTLSLIV
jgi:hypothetical protein